MRKDVLIVTSALVVAAILLIIAIPNYTGKLVLNTFSNGESTKTIVFNQSGWNNETSIEIPQNADIFYAYVVLHPEPVNGGYPTNVKIDVGGDGVDWEYKGVMISDQKVRIDQYIGSMRGKIPIHIYSGSAGKVVLKNLEVNYAIPQQQSTTETQKETTTQTTNYSPLSNVTSMSYEMKNPTSGDNITLEDQANYTVVEDITHPILVLNNSHIDFKDHFFSGSYIEVHKNTTLKALRFSSKVALDIKAYGVNISKAYVSNPPKGSVVTAVKLNEIAPGARAQVNFSLSSTVVGTIHLYKHEDDGTWQELSYQRVGNVIISPTITTFSDLVLTVTSVDWLVPGHDIQHTRHTTSDGPEYPMLIWNHTGINPLVNGTTLYFADGSTIYAYSLSDFSQKWSYDVGTPIKKFVLYPVAATQINVYVLDINGHIHALKTYSTSASPLFSLTDVTYNDISVFNGTLYASGTGKLYAYDAYTGDEKWNVTINTVAILEDMVIDQEDGKIYVTERSKCKIHVVNSIGNYVTTFDISGSSHGIPVIINNSLFMACDNSLLELSKSTGNILDNHTCSTTPPEASGDTSKSDSYAYACDNVLNVRNGGFSSTFAADSNIVTPVTISNGDYWFADAAHLYRWNWGKTALTWKYKFNGAGPIVIVNGRMIFSDGNNVYVFGEDPENPLVVINEPTNGQTYGKNVSINVTATDNQGIYEVKAEIDGSTNITLVNQSSYYVGEATLSNGTHTIKIYAKDLGWRTNSTETVTFNVDGLGPNISFNYPMNNTFYYEVELINVTVSDPSGVSAVIAEVDGSTNYTLVPDGNGNYYNDTVSIDTPGEHTIKIYSNDSFDNFATSTIKFNITGFTPTNEEYTWYKGGYNETDSHYYPVNTSFGYEPVYNITTTGTIRGFVIASTSDGVLLIYSDSGYVVARDLFNGTIYWNDTSQENISGSPYFDGNYVYFPTNDGKILRYYLNGHKDVYKLSDNALSGIVVDGDYLFAVEGYKVVAYNLTNETLLWASPSCDTITAPTIGGNKVYWSCIENPSDYVYNLSAYISTYEGTMNKISLWNISESSLPAVTISQPRYVDGRIIVSAHEHVNVLKSVEGTLYKGVRMYDELYVINVSNGETLFTKSKSHLEESATIAPAPPATPPGPAVTNDKIYWLTEFGLSVYDLNGNTIIDSGTDTYQMSIIKMHFIYATNNTLVVSTSGALRVLNITNYEGTFYEFRLHKPFAMYGTMMVAYRPYDDEVITVYERDVTAPNVTINYPEDGKAYVGDVLKVNSTIEDTSVIKEAYAEVDDADQYMLHRESGTNYYYNNELNISAPGTHKIEVYAVDSEGNSKLVQTTFVVRQVYMKSYINDILNGVFETAGAVYKLVLHADDGLSIVDNLTLCFEFDNLLISAAAETHTRVCVNEDSSGNGIFLVIPVGGVPLNYVGVSLYGPELRQVAKLLIFNDTLNTPPKDVVCEHTLSSDEKSLLNNRVQIQYLDYMTTLKLLRMNRSLLINVNETNISEEYYYGGVPTTFNLSLPVGDRVKIILHNAMTLSSISGEANTTIEENITESPTYLTLVPTSPPGGKQAEIYIHIYNSNGTEVNNYKLVYKEGNYTNYDSIIGKSQITNKITKSYLTNIYSIKYLRVCGE